MVLLHDEIHLLEMRLHELHTLVDIFVIAESNSTFTGKPKPSLFSQHYYLFKPFEHQIVHLHIGLPQDCAKRHTFLCEEYQRDYLYSAFVSNSGADDDLVLLSDVDEMPRPLILSALSRCDFDSDTRFDRLVRLWAAHLLYSAHCLRSEPWTWGPSAASGAFVHRYGTQQMRFPYARRTAALAHRQKRNQGLPCCLLSTQNHTRFGARFPRLRFACTRYIVRNYTGNEGRGTMRLFSATRLPDAGPSLAKYGDEPSARLQHGRKRFHKCLVSNPRHVEELILLDSAWHFSYFKSPEDIVIKYASVSWPRTYYPYNDSRFHRDNALRCYQPEHPKWHIERLQNIVDIPNFAKRNPCRMSVVFAYGRAS
jgi:hypothetical protein